MKKWLLIGAFAVWVWLLRGFVDTRLLIVLSLAGPLFVFSGLGIVRAMGPRLFRTGWTVGAFVVGLAMIAGGLATLAPAAPAAWLATSAWGWDLLDQRTDKLVAAVDAGNAKLTRRLANRGLGDIEPLDRSGRPVVQRATNVDVLAALLEAGLDPDARDDEGRTYLMMARDPGVVRALLAAGADVDARDREDSTVADAGSAPRGRTDWLTATGASPARLDRSAVTVEPPVVGRGETATISATLVNRADEDRLLDVSATLGDATLFVGGSHDGAIENPRQPRLLQTIRWPPLSLPARSQGRITLQVVTRSDAAARDLDVAWRVRALPSVEEETLRISQPLANDAATADPSAWSWGLPAAAAAAAAVVLWRMRRRRKQHGSASPPSGIDVPFVGSIVSAAVAVVCGLVAALFLWSIAEPYWQFEAAECTVLDHRIRTYTYQSSSSIDGSRRASSSQSETRTGFAPLAAVRIETGPTPIIAAGFDVGFIGSSVQDLKKYPLGSRVTCWVDPSFPGRFTLARRPSPGSWTALGALTMLGLVFMAIARGLRSGGGPVRQRRGRAASGR